MSEPTWARVVTGLSQLAACRRSLVDYLRGHHLDDGRIGDAALALTELVSNAFAHSHARDVHTAAAFDQTAFTVVVSHATSSQVELTDGTMPAPGSIGGRGLAIVHAVATDVQTTQSATTLTIQARFEFDT